MAEKPTNVALVTYPSGVRFEYNMGKVRYESAFLYRTETEALVALDKRFRAIRDEQEHGIPFIVPGAVVRVKPNTLSRR